MTRYIPREPVDRRFGRRDMPPESRPDKARGAAHSASTGMVLCALIVLSLGCGSTQRSTPAPGPTTTTTAQTKPQSRQSGPLDVRGVTNSTLDLTQQFETRMKTWLTQATDVVNGLKANASDLSQKIGTVGRDVSNLSKQMTSFATDPERARVEIERERRQAERQEKMHEADIERQAQYHRREISTHEKYTLMVTLIFVAVVCLGLSRHMHGWPEFALVVTGIVLLVGSGAAYFFYDSISRQ